MLKTIIIHGCDECDLVTTEFENVDMRESVPCPKCKKPLSLIVFKREQSSEKSEAENGT